MWRGKPTEEQEAGVEGEGGGEDAGGERDAVGIKAEREESPSARPDNAKLS